MIYGVCLHGNEDLGEIAKHRAVVLHSESPDVVASKLRRPAYLFQQLARNVLFHSGRCVAHLCHRIVANTLRETMLLVVACWCWLLFGCCCLLLVVVGGCWLLLVVASGC